MLYYCIWDFAHKLILVKGGYIRVYYSVLSHFVCLKISTVKIKTRKKMTHYIVL